MPYSPPPRRLATAYTPPANTPADVLARAVVDISGRPFLVHSGEPAGFEFHLIGGHFTGSMVRHVFEAISFHAGLTVHLNVVQELIQTEGDRTTGPLAAALAAAVAASPVPVLAKETGAGLTAEVAAALVDAGVERTKAVRFVGVGELLELLHLFAG